MCYGEIISNRMQKARKQKLCDACGKPIRVGRMKNVSISKIDGDFNVWQEHVRCGLALNATGAFDDEGCLYDAKGHLQAVAEQDGWRAMLAKIRAYVARRKEKKDGGP
jgi:hypothetical protein